MAFTLGTNTVEDVPGYLAACSAFLRTASCS